MNSSGHDLAAHLPVAQGAFASTAATAAGSGDSTSITGTAVDLTGLGARFNAALLVIGSQATLASGESLAVKTQIQYSANNSDWSNLTSVATLYTHTASGGAVTGGYSGDTLNVDLSKVGRYIRAVVTPDLSRAGTDTAVVFGCWAFGNPDKSL